MDPDNPDITLWLRRAEGGDRQAEEFVLECLRRELHLIAVRQLRGERNGHSLQATLLVNEAYLRLVRAHDRSWQDRNHFLALAARVMRHFLLDHAKAKLAAKRGGDLVRVELDHRIPCASNNPERFLELHSAIDRLQAMDPRLAKIVEMRYFGGMTEEEIGQELDLASRSVRRELKSARAWLGIELGQNGSSASSAISR